MTAVKSKMKTVIFYQSYLGTTKKYALWLAEDLKADLYTFKQANKEILSKYDQLVIASGTYAAKMPLTGFLQNNWSILKDKKVVVLSVGISPEGVPYTNQIINKIPLEIRKAVKIFRLPGSMFGFTPKEAGIVSRKNLEPIIKYLTTK